jgi:ABC-type transport system involved in multi-copper enzyme maturation permease subunit
MGAPARPGLAGALRGLWLLTWRSQLTLRQWPVRLGTLLVLPVLVYMTMAASGRRQLSEVSVPWSRTEPFYHWLINFYFFLILPLTCVRGCAPLIRDELQADTLGFLITRPVSRARLLLLKYACQVAWLEILLLLETLLLFAAGAARGVPALGTLLPLVLGVQMLAVPAWSALGLLLGQLTTRYMAAALLYGAIVEMGIGRIPTNINSLSIIRHLQVLLSQNAAMHGLYAWPSGKVATALGALLVAPVIFLGVAALLFSMVEYHHGAEMQK